MRARLRVVCTLGLCTLGLATGCERLLSIQDPLADDRGDAGGSDGGPGDGGLPAGSPILLSEVVLTPTPGEMIEIVNTSAQEVDLSTYYLSDSASYYRLPIQAVIDPTDFIVKFPDGARIGGQKAITIAIDTPENFMSLYGKLPDFSLRDGSLQTVSVTTMSNLTNTGEPIILFQWDGRSDLVRDVDLLLVGGPTVGNLFVDKSGVQQDGPDPGAQTSQYAHDVFLLKPQPSAPGAMQSTQRIALEATGNELRNGNGNGPDGHDETSEDTSVTWDGTTAHPFGTPTPGTVPDALLR